MAENAVGDGRNKAGDSADAADTADPADAANPADAAASSSVRCVDASITRDGSGDIPAALTCFSLNVAYDMWHISQFVRCDRNLFFSIFFIFIDVQTSRSWFNRGL